MAREISSGETGGSRSYQLQSDDDSGKTALRLRRRHTALSELYRSPPGLEASCTEPAASCTSRRLGMAGSGVRVARTSGRWKDPSALSALSAFVCLNDRGRQRRQGRQRFCGSGDLYRSRLSPQDCSSAGVGFRTFVQLAGSLQLVSSCTSVTTSRREARGSCTAFAHTLEEIETKTARLAYRPRVFFEEWSDPLISGIGWVEELIEQSRVCSLLRMPRRPAPSSVAFGDCRIVFSPDRRQPDRTCHRSTQAFPRALRVWDHQ